MKRNSQIGKNLADAGEQPWLVERNQLKERFTVGMGRQEIDLGIHGKVAQFCRLATRLRGLPAALGNRLLQT